MKRWLGAFALLVSLAAPRPAHAQSMVQRLLDRLTTRQLEQGYAVSSATSGGTITGSLSNGSTTTTSVTLRAGVRYMFVGVCDGDCSDLDMRIYNGGDVVGSDASTDDVPVVQLMPTSSGTYRVETTMAACSASPCGFGVRIFERSGTSESVASSSSGDASFASGCRPSDARFAVPIGQSRSGSLSSSSCRAVDRTPIEYYVMTVPSRQTVTMQMRSGDFDAYLMLYDASNSRLATDDDGAGGHDAQITRTLDAGTYYVGANAVSQSASGSYSLVTAAGGSSSVASSVASSGGSAGSTSASSGGTCPPTSTRAALVLGQPRTGSLTSSSCVRSDNSYADFYRLNVPTRQSVTISLTSGSFDAYLVLFDASGTSIVSNDDGAGGTDSRITRTLDAGTYYVAANTLSARATGSYTLSASSGGAAASTSRASGAAPGCGVTETRFALVPGQPRSGSLTSDSCVKGDGSYIDYYRLTISSRQRVTIDLASSEFDAYLVLYDANGTSIDHNDDRGGDTHDSRIVRTLDPGTYYVAANTLQSSETGAYTLTVSGDGSMGARTAEPTGMRVARR